MATRIVAPEGTPGETQDREKVVAALAYARMLLGEMRAKSEQIYCLAEAASASLGDEGLVAQGVLSVIAEMGGNHDLETYLGERLDAIDGYLMPVRGVQHG